jgi:hypothetical protein
VVQLLRLLLVEAQCSVVGAEARHQLLVPRHSRVLVLVADNAAIVRVTAPDARLVVQHTDSRTQRQEQPWHRST